MMTNKHALLSASSAHRWLNCTPSARLEEQFPDTTSEYAKEGTLAHEIAELKLCKHFIEPMGPKTFAARMNKFKKEELYQEEMQEHTDTYLEYVQSVVHSYASRPHIVIETTLDYSHIVPEGFGTGDCIIIGGNTLHVIDFKYGKGVPVDAVDNPQMKLYALGALHKYSMLYEIINVKLAIVQPRLNNISEWETTTETLFQWAEQIKPIAERAFKGEGDYRPGEWCNFCRAKSQCRARCETMTALEGFGYMKPPLISNAEVGEILVKARHLKEWVTDLEEYALSALLSGEEIPGWKAVEGRSNRQFEDVDKAFEVLKSAGYDEAVLYERKPITLTAVESLLGKKKFSELLDSYVIKPPGKPTLVPESDKREAITAQPKAAEVFKD